MNGPHLFQKVRVNCWPEGSRAADVIHGKVRQKIRGNCRLVRQMICRYMLKMGPFLIISHRNTIK